MWASASEEVDKRLSENFTVPITYVQMSGGQATFWLVDAAGGFQCHLPTDAMIGAPNRAYGAPVGLIEIRRQSEMAIFG